MVSQFGPEKIFAMHQRPSGPREEKEHARRSCRGSVEFVRRRQPLRFRANTRELLLLPALHIATDAAWVRPRQVSSARVLTDCAVPQSTTWGRSRSAAPGLDPPHTHTHTHSLPPPPPPRTCYSALKTRSSQSSLSKQTFTDETPTAVTSAESASKRLSGHRNIPVTTAVAAAISAAAFCQARRIFANGMM